MRTEKYALLSTELLEILPVENLIGPTVGIFTDTAVLGSLPTSGIVLALDAGVER